MLLVWFENYTMYTEKQKYKHTISIHLWWFNKNENAWNIVSVQSVRWDEWMNETKKQ